ncbi:nodulation protein NfeD [Salinicola endophyticus]|uniref:Nodulation protein NfeD n=1 Tax=Salinicola endophyticus TaxID=1949083 RepID=A0ABY8FKP0_9GAMM|nr:nodulation protein NfeD [Salinicola endophyticus]WFF40449.1 nodulation protein NfeD [Salinicola endophyticus]
MRVIRSPRLNPFRCRRREVVRRGLWLACLLLGGWLALVALAQPPGPATALILTLDDSLNPATRDYLERGIAEAERRQAALVVIELDTPGGQFESLRRLAQTILASRVPVVTYVTPSGARAASAGTYLLYASQVAAMTPGTHLGSATPVAAGGDDAEDSPMRRKIVEDAVAMLRGYAEHYGRNAEWAERAVREAANLSAERALELGVVDVVADDLNGLMTQLDGRQVLLASGERRLATADLVQVREPPGWRTQLLSLIATPTIAYGLLLLGFYGLVFELASPGIGLPGVAGGIALLLGLFAFQLLALDVAALALVLLGLALIVGEAFLPSFGVLGLGGIVAFVLGSIMLMDGAHSDLAWPLVGGTALVAGGFLLWAVLRLVAVRRRLPQAGSDEMLGAEALALTDFSAGRGKVQVRGERWQARSGVPIRRGDKLRITRVEGLVVTVEPHHPPPAA